MINKLEKVIQDFEKSRYFKRFGLHIRIPRMHSLNGVASKETVTKDEFTRLYSDENNEFSEVDLTDDEIFNRKSKKSIPKRGENKKMN